MPDTPTPPGRLDTILSRIDEVLGECQKVVQEADRHIPPAVRREAREHFGVRSVS